MAGNIQMDPNDPAEVLIPPFTWPEGTVVTAPQANRPIGSPDGLPNEAQGAVDAATERVNTDSSTYNFDAAVTTQYTAFRQLAQSRYGQP